MYETGEMSLKKSISLYGPQSTVLVKQNRIPESFHDFREGGVSRGNVTNLQFSFRVPYTGVYI